MEKGAKALAYLLSGALALGLLVVLVHPDYRRTAVSLFRGEPMASPLWRSNQNYYDGVLLQSAEEDSPAEDVDAE